MQYLSISPTHTCLPPSYKNLWCMGPPSTPGLSPHLGILNLITPVKSLLPDRVTGSGEWNVDTFRVVTPPSQALSSMVLVWRHLAGVLPLPPYGLCSEENTGQ